MIACNQYEQTVPNQLWRPRYQVNLSDKIEVMRRFAQYQMAKKPSKSPIPKRREEQEFD